jgi:hypothetical protein
MAPRARTDRQACRGFRRHLNDPTLASQRWGKMTTKRCTVAQLLLRLRAVTWLTAEGFHNMTTRIPRILLSWTSRFPSLFPRQPQAPLRRSLYSASGTLVHPRMPSSEYVAFL